ncbi:MAG TPA: peptidyl-alpha-hydroxyglycine alpha-amidating lyase family protein [Candidatus Limnocylindria bacterium]|nr:peptidyl-alpha-hydroxyglycine alpha-amidating lyase family protein [Candidatus Limnocylindria bacterium]
MYERDGRFVRAWPEGLFSERAHGITAAPDGSIWCVDDADHSVRKFTPDGEVLRTLGTRGVPSATGYDGTAIATIHRAGPPFNRPTNLAVAPTGDLYVTDGYGNARVHQFAPSGTLIRSWGAPGTGPGEFRLPHGIAILPDGRVLVADRENDRIQIFDLAGAFVGEWLDVQRPTHLAVGPDGLVYVTELPWLRGQRSLRFGDVVADRYGRVTALTDDGEAVARWGGRPMGTPGAFTAPHGIAVDSRGDVYVAEVTYTIGVAPGLIAPGGAPTLQKLARR